LLGEEGAGFRIAMRILDRSRPGIGAQGLGLAQGATDYALEYAKNRETMGKPIAEHQLIAATLADMETKCEAARGLLYKCGPLIDRVVGELGLGTDSTVLDLGAGTGKLTRALVPRFARVIAVEPDGAMRSVLEEVVPGAEALFGSAGAIPLEAESVDAVFTAEAFHWFASDETVAEIARLLRPGGGLAIFWNVWF